MYYVFEGSFQKLFNFSSMIDQATKNFYLGKNNLKSKKQKFWD